MDDRMILKQYLENEIYLSYENMEKAEKEMEQAMETFKRTLSGYNIDESNFADKTKEYEQLFKMLRIQKEQGYMNDLKELTVYFVILTMNLNNMVKFFAVRYRKLIQEAAQK